MHRRSSIRCQTRNHMRLPKQEMWVIESFTGGLHRRAREQVLYGLGLPACYVSLAVIAHLSGDLSLSPLSAQPRGSNSVRHQERGNLRDNIRQIARIVRNAFDKSAPLPLLLFIFGKCFRQGIR